MVKPFEAPLHDSLVTWLEEEMTDLPGIFRKTLFFPRERNKPAVLVVLIF